MQIWNTSLNSSTTVFGGVTCGSDLSGLQKSSREFKRFANSFHMPITLTFDAIFKSQKQKYLIKKNFAKQRCSFFVYFDESEG